MSNLVSQYLAEIERIVQRRGSRQNNALRYAFQKLLNEYCKTRDFQLVSELGYQTRSGRIVYPNGTVKDVLRLDWGYWVSKNRDDNLDREIETKFSQGYPDSNTLFDNSQTAVLIQNGTEVMRVSMQDGEALDRIVTNFINYVRPEVRDFRTAIETFKQDLPTILDSLRDAIARQNQTNVEFRNAINQFWEICKQSINPELTLLDIREMMLQHILTEDIFTNIFNEAQFHHENTIARELQRVINTFLYDNARRNLISTIERYYGVIRRTAVNIYSHQEKQKFLKAVYENFYKAYNPIAVDRLGIIYTPNEIVHFMINSVDYLVRQHFSKSLADKEVEILDPATGTGTFITELIEYLPKNKLKYKYNNEIHCNEVAILPYYIANLNIEYTYKQKMGKYEKFNNLCFVDTLEHTTFEGKQGNLFASNVENMERVKRQNERTISVIIGNPPYNTYQISETENNQNIKYPAIDRRIKDTYIRNSKARKTKVYDMYARFLRWASDRLGENGVIAFVSNNSFIDARTYDGFRKTVTEEFNEIYIIDLKGNARTSGERRRREGGNVFNNKIRVGIAVYFLVKKRQSQGCRIYYNAVADYADIEEKKAYLADHRFQDLQFERIIPDEDNNWINLTNNDFGSLLILADRDTKSANNQALERAVFKLFSLGVITARDEWVYAETTENIEQKVRFLINAYNQDVEAREARNISISQSLASGSIKWTRAVRNDLLKSRKYSFAASCIRDSLYRPFVKRKLYFSKKLNEMQYQLRQIFPKPESHNLLIAFTDPGSSKPFMCLASDRIPDYHLVGDSQCLPLYRYDTEDNQIDNITDWGLVQFQNHYNDSTITKLDIFYYTYAVLHYPAYRTQYALNLKREFPRLPFYNNFRQWVNWGQQLMNLHVNYQTVAPYPLNRIDRANYVSTPKTKLKADKNRGTIAIDSMTTLADIPAIAWEYRLGDRSALEWVLEHYKEKTPKDRIVAERFHTYRFANYKEQVIDLLQRVCTVSVETMRIIREMEST